MERVTTESGRNQAPSGGSGSGGGGEGGGSSGSGRGLGAGSNSKRVTKNDAQTYLMAVKEVFKDEMEKYDMFLDVMKDFKDKRTDVVGVIARVKELFKGHNDLICGFNVFLSDGYEITLDEDESPADNRFHFEDFFVFLNKLKGRFPNDEHVNAAFLKMLHLYTKGLMDIVDVFALVGCPLFDHPDLYEEFVRLSPDTSASE